MKHMPCSTDFFSAWDSITHTFKCTHKYIFRQYTKINSFSFISGGTFLNGK